VVNPGTPEERQLKPLSDNNRLRQGDLLRVMTSGGGGWGHPCDRPAATVREDVLDGFVSPASALTDYGVVLAPQTLELDEVETSQLRKDRRAEMAMFHRGHYLSIPPASVVLHR
jgi:N-methylhydantoinase B